MKISAFLLFFLFSSKILIGQSFYFKIQLSDKDTATFKNSSPIDFLSSKAVSRKMKFQVPIDIQDFPITPVYLDSIGSKLTIKTYSKWFNQVIVATPDSINISSIEHLPFISTIDFIGKSQFNANKLSKTDGVTIDYGQSMQAIQQVNGDYLHANSLNGNNLLIAVLDAGFVNVNFMQDFAHLYSSNRIIATKNYVFNNNSVYTMDNHGTMVLSVLAAKKEGEIFGTATDASYVLLLTEDVREEHLIEEYYWTNGAEFSDSLGVDIINSSLGYNTFDATNFNHSINELGQNSTPISKAARFASQKGILVVSSAGNEGETSWKYINFPSDEELVLTVGGTKANGEKVGFSSFGYTGTNSIKPNVVALGESVNVTASNGAYTDANGTSFSSPIIAGLAACLWEALPNKTSQEIKTLIEESAHQYSSPDLLLGYGIPNFKQIVQTHSVQQITVNDVTIYPNPTSPFQPISISSKNDLLKKINIFNNVGQLIYTKYFNENSKFQTIQVNNLGSGSYIVSIVTTTGSTSEKLLVL